MSNQNWAGGAGGGGGGSQGGGGGIGEFSNSPGGQGTLWIVTIVVLVILGLAYTAAYAPSEGMRERAHGQLNRIEDGVHGFSGKPYREAHGKDSSE